MTHKVLDSVILVHDIPAHGLKEGDLGAVVEVYPQGGMDVEFVTCAGETEALVTLHDSDIRGVDSSDLLAARRVSKRKKKRRGPLGAKIRSGRSLSRTARASRNKIRSPR
jgi:hypothetical protein